MRCSRTGHKCSNLHACRQRCACMQVLGHDTPVFHRLAFRCSPTRSNPIGSQTPRPRSSASSQQARGLHVRPRSRRVWAGTRARRCRWCRRSVRRRPATVVHEWTRVDGCEWGEVARRVRRPQVSRPAPRHAVWCVARRAARSWISRIHHPHVDVAESEKRVVERG